MLDSSVALLLLILLGVIILVILATMFIFKINSITHGIEKKLNEVDKSICKLENKIDTSKYVDIVAQRVEESIQEVANTSSRSLYEAKDGNIRRGYDGVEAKVPYSSSIKNDDVIKAKITPILDVKPSDGLQGRELISDSKKTVDSVSNLDKQAKTSNEFDDFWNNLERTAPDKKQVEGNSNVEDNRNRFGFVSRDETVAVDITEIKEEPVHSIDAVMASLPQKTAGSFAGSTEPLRNTREVEAKSRGLDSIIDGKNANNKPQITQTNNNEVKLSFAEKLKKEANKMKKDKFDNKESVQQAVEIQPVAQEKVIKSIDAVSEPWKTKATPHFVDRVSGIDRRGRVYSVEQLKEQIK